MITYLYITTCIPTGKTYVGVHKGKVNDSYIGCAIRCQADAIRLQGSYKSAFVDSVVKYGYINFKKEVIMTFSKPEDAYSVERLIVDKDWVKSDDNYNIKGGGIGGGLFGRRRSRGKLSKKGVENYSKCKMGRKNPNFVGMVYTPSGSYEGFAQAARAYNIHEKSMRYRVESTKEKWKDYYIVREN